MKLDPDIVALPWYEAESFQAVMALMQDPHALFATHAAWQAKAERTEDLYRRAGKTTVRVVLDVVNFKKWCDAQPPGLRIDAKARIDYAVHVAHQQQRAL